MSKPPPPLRLPDTEDPYVLLDVRPGATNEQIRRAYLRCVKQWKPDRHPAEFRRVREAYDRLREQERWFDAWRQATDVVRRATEVVADQEPSVEELTELERDVAREDAEDEGGEDVEALIAALEDELRDEPAGTEDSEDSEAEDSEDSEPADTDERRRRSERAAALAEQLAELEEAIHAALEAEHWTDAAERLLAPGVDALAAHSELAPLLLEVCCAVVWTQPDQFTALVARYGDLVSAHDTEHHDGALLHRRILSDELPAWRAAVADHPELMRFVALGSSLRPPAEAELGLRLGKRATEDPTAFLRTLTRAAAEAPGILGLFVNMAERWARYYGRLSLPRPVRARPTLEQAGAALAELVQHHRQVRWAQARPLFGSAAVVLALALARSPVVELVVVGLMMLLWAWQAWVADPEAWIYARVLRPAAAGWLWATQASPRALAAALQARLPARGTWAAMLHPGDLHEYPPRLCDDLALTAFSATSPMIPLLRRPDAGNR